MVERLFLAVPWGCLQFVIVVFPYHTHLLFLMITRTHSIARHGKSPCSQRNLMAFDPLTPSQGHQFDPRVKIFSVFMSTAHPL